ncbi:MAG: LysR family transcriptional regulator [Candidatus Thiodiazotropha sp. (ex Lucinoma borealis)]|nr:LysR family transcriptional regulator [Candidatus Thiodiazotropha sp. (ex Lucinoma borealis)]
MVDFEWYRSFIAVYLSGTVTGAVKVRFLTQPAISQHIAALESAVGHALFQRTPRKMVPTEHGKALYSRIAPAMDGLERMSATLRDTSTTEIPVIRMGTPLDYFQEVGIEKLKNSQFCLQIELGDAEKMIDGMSRGRLDAVIATQQIRGENIDYTKIDQEDFCLVAAPEITLPKNLKKKLSKPNEVERFLLEQQWISYSVELPIIRRFWHTSFSQRPDIKPILVVSSLLLIRKAVELGWGISVLPRYICQQSLSAGRLHILWEPKEPIVNDLWVATRKVDRNKTEIGQLISLMRYNHETNSQ